MQPKTEPPYDKLMAYLDGEMSPAQRRDFERLLEQHPEWRNEVAEMADVVKATQKLKLRTPDPHMWDNYWEEIDDRLQRKTGWLIALIGALLLSVVGIWKVLVFSDNMYVRSGIVLIIIGTAILFAAVVRGRLLEYPRDRYRRIRK